MPATDRQELIDQLIRETSDGATARPDVSVLVAAALLAASSPDLLAEAMQAASTTADRQFVAIAVAHRAGDHYLVDALARDHLIDHPPRPVLVWIVNQGQDITINQGAHR
jgi:hypothetical protein